MQLTPEDIAKLETKELANVIRKLNAGGTLTAAQRALLARAKAGQGSEVQTLGSAPVIGFASNWDELATALGVSRKSLQNWRGRPDLTGRLPAARADGRHEVAAWQRAMAEHGLARADDDEEDDEEQPGERSIAWWRKHKEELACTKMARAIAKDDGALLVAAELEVAAGQLLAGICAALNQLPGSAARFLVGLRDVHVIQQKLEDEVATVLQHLGAARYLEDCVGDVVQSLPFDAETRKMFSVVAFDGQDKATLLQLVTICTKMAFAAVGRRALGQLTAPAAAAPEPVEVDVCPPVPESATPQTSAPTAESPRSAAAAPKAPAPKTAARRKKPKPARRRRQEIPAAAKVDQASDRPQATRSASTRRRRV